ncbi:Bifunctional nuclease 2 [Bienertia sinuspersici]
MLKAQLCGRSFQISGFGSSSSSSDQFSFLTHSLNFPDSCRFSLQFSSISTDKKCRRFPCISCKSHSHGNFAPKSYGFEPNDEYIEASLLISETVKHYHLRKQGFREEVKKLAGQVVPFSAQVKYLKSDVNSIGLSILRRFRHPTIFLKISCEGDFLLPIVVGEFAVEKLIDSLRLPKSAQLVKNLVDRLGNEVGEREYFSVDARPSDAISVAQSCKAPIYVNKQIVLTDAIRISYGTGRVPVKEERYNDAAMWRDKLVKLCNSEIRRSQPRKWHETSIPELP